VTSTLSGSEPLGRIAARAPWLTAKRLELISALILALGGTLTAWAAYQASKWSGLQSIAFSRAAAARVRATEASTQAGQQLLLDAVLFSDWVQAVSNEMEREAHSPENYRFVPDPKNLSGFIYRRFRPEFKPAVDAWLATRPLQNPGAPASPFGMAEYKLETRSRAEHLNAVADREATSALEDNAHADRYVFTTVILASALFFAGVSIKVEARSTRMFLNVVAVAILSVAVGLLLSFPAIF
jgi:hypothetical protein